MLLEQELQLLLNKYGNGTISREELQRLFEILCKWPFSEEKLRIALRDLDPKLMELFFSDNSKLDVTLALSEEEESQIELYLSGLMSQTEEKDFLNKINSDEGLSTNVLARALLFKAIKRIYAENKQILSSAKQLKPEDVADTIKDIRNEEIDDEIDRYLSDRLSKAEKDAFESKMSSDARFKERVMSISMLYRTIKDQQEDASLTLKDASKLTKSDVLSVIAQERGAGKVGTRWWRYAAAAVVTLLIGGTVFFDYYNSTRVMNLAGENMNFSIDEYNRGGYTRGSEGVVKELTCLFEIVKGKDNIPDSTISRLREYYDIATDSNIDFEDDYVNEISLAMATAYVYTGQKSEAKAVLEQIINSHDVTAETRRKAKALLRKIKWSIIF